MLTGDKVETAICIARSSNLCYQGQKIHKIVNLRKIYEAQNELESLQSQAHSTCLVIDGQSLQFYLSNMKLEFIKIATNLACVVCCRCSPTQKAEITQLIKTYTKKRTLAIGDGGNDVSMIQMANVGVGIVGKEGKQASLAADFSVEQFSALTRLLLWHGRNSYKRSAKISLFIIHRGLIISTMQVVFSAIFYFSPIALFQGVLLVGYTTLYTNFPVFALVLDSDITEDIALMYPELYKDLTKGRTLSYRTFFTWFLISVYQGGIIMLFGILLFDQQFINIISICFTSLILNELITVALEVDRWHWYMFVSQLLSLGFYALSIYLFPNEFDIAFILTQEFWWKVGLITILSCFPLFIIRCFKKGVKTPEYTKLN
ncbi:ATPase, P-type, K/Mg/Cd/Cu/Zn/Na/Ca/Na/H-transporter [Conidiobolus coronatus NRRL 28638]|uniref:ATPase, P-type, K/Mg/Cd/Cu/Zn/Na/Ca/Na/H-transporter n=1 Tax=Conidiobolus coronatus (strain ATCC 28846 / CBS 209.66 / NRRL 28638) TaxID=796925 RepID=A0A137NSY8_CONC2|nr:ATPase, P-type, K/Mg/Cd/Cu/Zn/Na/Ca/Na/H-transporter [Conidiobolus coronatus NRRL 28638]|eukprot:KXN65905.1 ATPase, P-type, K/Mg/Cd/Cu/Zn/Na/Ca/Na/H-transporter [Conidiobolus coronatus NRRL 28638]